MTRIREIKKYAGMWVIKLSPTDAQDFGLVEGDKVDIDDLVLIQEAKKKVKKMNNLQQAEELIKEIFEIKSKRAEMLGKFSWEESKEGFDYWNNKYLELGRELYNKIQKAKVLKEKILEEFAVADYDRKAYKIKHKVWRAENKEALKKLNEILGEEE